MQFLKDCSHDGSAGALDRKQALGKELVLSVLP
jgi:hypothetical protein